MRGRVNPGQTWRLLGEPREQGVQEDLPGGPSWPPAHGFFEDGAFPFLTGGCGLCAHTVPSASREQRLEGPSICGTGSLAWLGRQQAGRLAKRKKNKKTKRKKELKKNKQTTTCLGINLTKMMKDLYAENYKTLIKEMKMK